MEEEEEEMEEEQGMTEVRNVSMTHFRVLMLMSV